MKVVDQPMVSGVIDDGCGGGSDHGGPVVIALEPFGAFHADPVAVVDAGVAVGGVGDPVHPFHTVGFDDVFDDLVPALLSELQFASHQPSTFRSCTTLPGCHWWKPWL